MAGWRSGATGAIAEALAARAGGALAEATKNPGPGVVVIHKPEHQLPLFAVRFRAKTQSELNEWKEEETVSLIATTQT